MQAHVAQAELWTLPVDAIIVPANSMGIMGGGVLGHIKRHGGDVIQQASMAAAPIAIGAAIVTTAGQLPCGHVIHVPTMEEPGQRVSAESVRRAVRAGLIAADINHFKVVGIPGIGCDFGDVQPEEAVRAIVEELRAHKRPCPETVYLVDTQEAVVVAFEEAMRTAQANF